MYSGAEKGRQGNSPHLHQHLPFDQSWVVNKWEGINLSIKHFSMSLSEIAEEVVNLVPGLPKCSLSVLQNEGVQMRSKVSVTSRVKQRWRPHKTAGKYQRVLLCHRQMGNWLLILFWNWPLMRRRGVFEFLYLASNIYWKLERKSTDKCLDTWSPLLHILAKRQTLQGASLHHSLQSWWELNLFQSSMWGCGRTSCKQKMLNVQEFPLP